jgi:hypothetical protein
VCVGGMCVWGDVCVGEMWGGECVCVGGGDVCVCVCVGWGRQLLREEEASFRDDTPVRSSSLKWSALNTSTYEKR